MTKVGLLFGYGQNASGELLPQTIARCNAAFNAYRTSKISKIYITCHVTTAGKEMCDKMAEYLLARTIPAIDIVCVPKATNTAGEIDVFLMLIDKANDEVTAISTSYHLPRIWYLFWTRGVKARLIGSSQGTSWKDLRIEPLKMLNSLLRPFSSAKKIL